MVGEKIGRVMQDLRARLTEIYGTRLLKLVLYGSQARGEASDESDIDVLVVLKGSVDPGEEIARSEYAVSAVSLAHQVVVTCFFVSEEQYAVEQSPLLLNIRREGVVV